MKKLLFILNVLVFLPLNAMEGIALKVLEKGMSLSHVDKVISHAGAINLYRNNKDFFIEKNSNLYVIKRCWLDKKLREVPADKIAKFLAASYIVVNQLNDGQFTINSNVRGLGGGPQLAIAVNIGTRIVGYTSLIITVVGGIIVGASVAAPGVVPVATGVAVTASTTVGLAAAATEAMGVMTGGLAAIEATADQLSLIALALPTP